MKFYCNINVHKGIFWILTFLIMDIFSLSAQETLSNGNAINLPFRKYGISIGNSYEFNGLRVNYADDNVRQINGVNMTLWVKKFKSLNTVVNGVSIGGFPISGKMQPINLGIVGVGSNQANGITIGGIVVGSGGNINGISFSGLVTMADGSDSKISGVALSGIGIGARRQINGIAIGGVAVGTDGDINGLTASTAYLQSKGNIRGVAVTPGYLKALSYKGIAIAGYSTSSQMHGLSIALFNKTNELRGIQIGLLNIAENNIKGFRVMPVINMHFKRKIKNHDTSDRPSGY